MIQFLSGALAMGCLAAGLFFLRFWRRTGDRLFAFFALAFLVFAINWIALPLGKPTDETRPYFYLIRLASFVLILGGIFDKNLRRPRRPPGPTSTDPGDPGPG